jgi:hypothetical protein
MATPNYVYVQRILQSETVRKRLRVVQSRMASQAGAYARQAGVNVPIQLSEGTRPGGRPYARIAIPATNEFGDSKTKRLRILGRVISL